MAGMAGDNSNSTEVAVAVRIEISKSASRFSRHLAPPFLLGALLVMSISPDNSDAEKKCVITRKWLPDEPFLSGRFIGRPMPVLSSSSSQRSLTECSSPGQLSREHSYPSAPLAFGLGVSGISTSQDDDGLGRPSLETASRESSSGGSDIGATVPRDVLRNRRQFTWSEALANIDRCISSFSWDQPDKACLSQAFVDTASFVVVGSGTLFKLPQILKILFSGNLGGLSESCLIPDVLSAALFAAYNSLLGVPFVLWGEIFSFAIQNALLLLLVWWYGERRDSVFSNAQRLAIAAGMVGVFTGVMKGGLSRESLRVVGLLPIPLMVVSRCPRLWRNYQCKHTKNQQLGPYLSLIVGSTMRVVTTVIEIDDVPSLVTCGVDVSFHVMAAFQILFYRRRARQVMAEESKSKSKE